jgi:transaldolase
MTNVHGLRVKIFADGADLDVINQLAAQPHIKGFTTNPTLMRKAGVRDYRAFAVEALDRVGDRPISFEVFSDQFDEMEHQAHEIASWGPNVYVKIPVTNTRGDFSGDLVRRLSSAGIQVNVTALLTVEQVARVADCLARETRSFISLFAGRIADTGLDPVPHVGRAVEVLRVCPRAQLIWASPRELLNVIQADQIGCHVITATNDVLKKLFLIGKNLDEFSLETVQMFRDDALAAGYAINVTQPVGQGNPRSPER